MSYAAALIVLWFLACSLGNITNYNKKLVSKTLVFGVEIETRMHACARAHTTLKGKKIQLGPEYKTSQ